MKLLNFEIIELLSGNYLIRLIKFNNYEQTTIYM